MKNVFRANGSNGGGVNGSDANNIITEEDITSWSFPIGTYKTMNSTYPTMMATIIRHNLEPKKIIFNGRTTIVLWNDGTKSMSTCSPNDYFDEQIGFSVCLLKKMFGKKVYGKRLYERMLSRAEHQVTSKNENELPF